MEAQAMQNSISVDLMAATCMIFLMLILALINRGQNLILLIVGWKFEVNISRQNRMRLVSPFFCIADSDIFSISVAIFPWGKPCSLSKKPGKVVGVLKAHATADFRNTIFLAFKKTCGDLNT